MKKYTTDNTKLFFIDGIMVLTDQNNKMLSTIFEVKVMKQLATKQKIIEALVEKANQIGYAAE